MHAFDQAQAASEDAAIETQLLSSVRDASDIDATQDALLHAALAASAAEAGMSIKSWGDSIGVSRADSTETSWSGSGGTGCVASGASGPIKNVDAPKYSQGLATSADAVCDDALAPGDSMVLSSEVKTLLAMGFSLPSAVQAHAQFGDDLDSMLEYLTRD